MRRDFSSGTCSAIFAATHEDADGEVPERFILAPVALNKMAEATGLSRLTIRELVSGE